MNETSQELLIVGRDALAQPWLGHPAAAAAALRVDVEWGGVGLPPAYSDVFARLRERRDAPPAAVLDGMAVCLEALLDARDVAGYRRGMSWMRLCCAPQAMSLIFQMTGALGAKVALDYSHALPTHFDITLAWTSGRLPLPDIARRLDNVGSVPMALGAPVTVTWHIADGALRAPLKAATLDSLVILQQRSAFAHASLSTT